MSHPTVLLARPQIEQLIDACEMQVVRREGDDDPHMAALVSGLRVLIAKTEDGTTSHRARLRLDQDQRDELRVAAEVRLRETRNGGLGRRAWDALDYARAAVTGGPA